MTTHRSDTAREAVPASPRKPADGQKQGSRAKEIPAAGPHAKPELTNPLATPGSGTLAEPGAKDATDSTGG